MSIGLQGIKPFWLIQSKPNKTQLITKQMKSTINVLALAACLFSGTLQAQNFPDEMHLSPDGKRLVTGDLPNAGLFDQSIIRNINLTFNQANYWTLLTNNFASKTDLLAAMEVDGVVFDSVGVRFKGQTSYSQVNGQKKSFNITIDSYVPGQDLMGYDILNLNNCFQDASFLREVFYQSQIKKYIPAAKSSFIHLYLNGQDWGIYPMVQQLNGSFLKEWFLSNDGTNWRADRPPGSPGGPGGGWGDGTAALNYLGNDTSLFKQYYTLKSTEFNNPWDYLRDACLVLDTVSNANMETALATYLDIDRALWFLACEIAFTDDDGYVYKGKMDYYVYYESETGRIVPLEYDGNSCMDLSRVTTWSPFYNQTNANYPLLNRILAVPALRQRYLAHMRTIVNEAFDLTTSHAKLDAYKAQIDALVQSDPKKIYTYAQFTAEVTELKTFMTNRRNALIGNAEVAQVAPTITATDMLVNGTSWTQPTSADSVSVITTITSTNGLDHVYLYTGTGIVGNFTKADMYDDGLHADGAPADGIYGATIAALPAGTWVRFYIEAAAANTAKSVKFDPQGAEHDVYIYYIAPVYATNSDIVINELMAKNLSTAADSTGEFDDWIELYNKTANPVDLTGYIITDNEFNLTKYSLPAATIMPANSYLIIWADEDGGQGNFHANFQLSGSGEKIMLLNPLGQIADEVTYGQQVDDQGYARIPNGTGNFVIQAPTFAANNETVAITPTSQDPHWNIYPNPAGNFVRIVTSTESQHPFTITDAYGRTIFKNTFTHSTLIPTADWAAGLYIINHGTKSEKLIIQH